MRMRELLYDFWTHLWFVLGGMGRTTTGCFGNFISLHCLCAPSYILIFCYMHSLFVAGMAKIHAMYTVSLGLLIVFAQRLMLSHLDVYY